MPQQQGGWVDSTQVKPWNSQTGGWVDAGIVKPHVETPAAGLGGFGREFWQRANPVDMVKGLWESLKAPMDGTVMGMLPNLANLVKADPKFLDQAREHAARGDYATAARKVLSYASMGLGHDADAQADLWQQGRYSEAAGAAAGTTAAFLGPGKVMEMTGGLNIPALARNRNPAEVRAVEAGRAAGVPIDAATATGNPFVRFAQRAADESLLGSMVGGAATARQQAGLATMGEQVAARASRARTPVTPVAAGEGIQQGLTATRDAAHAAADAGYTRLRTIEAQNPVQIDLRAAKAAVEPIYAQMATGADIAPLQGGKAVAARAMARLLEGPDFAPLSVADSALSDLKALLRREVPTARFQVGQVEQAVQQGVRQMGPDAVRALQEGRAATRAKYAAQDVLDIASGEPAGAFSRVTRAGDATRNHLRDVIAQAPTSRPLIGRAVLDGLIDNPSLTPGRALTQWRKIGPETKAMLYAPEHIRAIDDFLLLRERIAQNPNPSGSGLTVLKGGELFLQNPGLTFSTPVLSALLHSPTGARLLSQGFRIPMLSAPAKGAWLAGLAKEAERAGVSLAQPSPAPSQPPVEEAGAPAPAPAPGAATNFQQMLQDPAGAAGQALTAAGGATYATLKPLVEQALPYLKYAWDKIAPYGEPPKDMKVDELVAAIKADPNIDPISKVTGTEVLSQIASSGTPLGVVMGMAGLGPTKRLAKAADIAGEAAGAAQTALRASKPAASVLDEIKALFPRLDAYTKPTGRLTAERIIARVEGAENLSDEARAALKQVAEQVGTRRVAADEVHALAAGTTYKPDRVLRKVKAPVEGQKNLPGAPLGITNARQARALRENYLATMDEGASGRDWYHDSGEAILFHANDIPERARLVAGDMAITSPATSVGANSGMGVKGYNQATAGVPVEAGRFPTAMGKNIQALHDGGEKSLGLKRDPFAQNIALGGGFHETQIGEGVTLLPAERALGLGAEDVEDAIRRAAAAKEVRISKGLGEAPDPKTLAAATGPQKRQRAVHDIWDAEAHGYVNEDGTPMRTGFGPAQHRFMDAQQDKIIVKANQQALSGHTNWDELRSQAAAWTGAKVRAGDIKKEDAAKSFADHIGELYSQGGRETVPGRSTGHMPELLRPEYEAERRLLHDMVREESGIYDAQGRDQIAAGYGALVGRGLEGPGMYEGAISPGWQTRVLTGSRDIPGGAKGARELDEGSRLLMDAAEDSYAIIAGQDASAHSRVLPQGSRVQPTAWEVALPNGTITEEQLRELERRFGPAFKEMIPIFTPEGVRLAGMDAARAKAVVKILGGKITKSGALQGGYNTNDWQIDRVGQLFQGSIRRLGTAKFDASIPEKAQRLRDIDARFTKETGGKFTLSPVLDEVRAAIAHDGFPGLEKLAKKYSIPAILLAAALTELQGEPRADTSRE